MSNAAEQTVLDLTSGTMIEVDADMTGPMHSGPDANPTRTEMQEALAELAEFERAERASLHMLDDMREFIADMATFTRAYGAI